MPGAVVRQDIDAAAHKQCTRYGYHLVTIVPARGRCRYSRDSAEVVEYLASARVIAEIRTRDVGIAEIVNVL